jgi:hypothetical protein
MSQSPQVECGRHRFFFGVDPKQPEYPSQVAAIEARVKGNWRVRCGHCGVSLMGSLGDPGPVTELIWRHDGTSWFGSFSVLEPPSGG